MNTVATTTNENAVPRLNNVSQHHADRDRDDRDHGAGRQAERLPPGPGDDPSDCQPDEERRAIRSTSPRPDPSSSFAGRWRRTRRRRRRRGRRRPGRDARHVSTSPVVWPSSFGGETAERAFEERQWVRPVAVVIGVGVEGHDVTEDEEVVAHLVHALDLAVDPRHGRSMIGEPVAPACHATPSNRPSRCRSWRTASTDRPGRG